MKKGLALAACPGVEPRRLQRSRHHGLRADFRSRRGPTTGTGTQASPPCCNRLDGLSSRGTGTRCLSRGGTAAAAKLSPSQSPRRFLLTPRSNYGDRHTGQSPLLQTSRRLEQQGDWHSLPVPGWDRGGCKISPSRSPRRFSLTPRSNIGYRHLTAPVPGFDSREDWRRKVPVLFLQAAPTASSPLTFLDPCQQCSQNFSFQGRKSSSLVQADFGCR